MSKNDKKKKILSQKTVSFQNVFTDTKRAVLKTLPGNYQRQAEFFSAQCPENTKKRFNLKNASKSFYGHVASILTSPMRKLQKRLEFFHAKYTQETSPDETLLLRGFLWTLRLQFRQTCQESFARMLKLLLDVQKIWKKRKRF